MSRLSSGPIPRPLWMIGPKSGLTAGALSKHPPVSDLVAAPGPSHALTWRPIMAALSDVTIPIASYHHRDFPIGQLRTMKKDTCVSVCIPARGRGGDAGTDRRGRTPGARRRCGTGRRASRRRRRLQRRHGGGRQRCRRPRRTCVQGGQRRGDAPGRGGEQGVRRCLSGRRRRELRSALCDRSARPDLHLSADHARQGVLPPPSRRQPNGRGPRHRARGAPACSHFCFRSCQVWSSHWRERSPSGARR